MQQKKWMLLSEKDIIKAYNSSNTLRDFSILLGYSSAKTKKELMPLFEKYNLDPEKFNYHKGLDLTGQIFGDLEVLELDEQKTKEHHRKYWTCWCRGCNNKLISVSQSNLTSGCSRSCGCQAKKDRRDNLIGQTFGFLEVIELDEENTLKTRGKTNYKSVYWKCKCLKCNREDLISVSANHLKSGHTTTCGCGKNSNYSVAEEKIKIYLEENNYNFKTQYTFSDLKDKGLLRFDFAIFNNKNEIKCLLEYNGLQHYYAKDAFGGEKGLINQQKRDNLKKEYCKNHNIPLIILNYKTGYTNQVLESVLKKVERSETAQIADYLDNIDGTII